eukprot:CAMPEP_0119382568 /NCGR_PEP_ID=MMETSP1334-20130426/73300_1 /TAXON_ID=127549 /ORGANISM="Calcidiscus leptoporus, Strain RCC1130" /LENGTH=74 /DNA_ID=CAMNT_0007403081 /DNA_START=167 /DNA_END=388 /DNA_ORIENTATION=+
MTNGLRSFYSYCTSMKRDERGAYMSPFSLYKAYIAIRQAKLISQEGRREERRQRVLAWDRTLTHDTTSKLPNVN